MEKKNKTQKIDKGFKKTSTIYKMVVPQNLSYEYIFKTNNMSQYKEKYLKKNTLTVYSQHAINEAWLHFLENPEYYENVQKSVIETYLNISDNDKKILELIKAEKRAMLIIDAYEVVLSKYIPMRKEHVSFKILKKYLDPRVKDSNNYKDYLPRFRDSLFHNGHETLLSHDGTIFTSVRPQQIPGFEVPTEAFGDAMKDILREGLYDKFNGLNQRQTEVLMLLRNVFSSQDYSVTKSKLLTVKQKKKSDYSYNLGVGGISHFLQNKLENNSLKGIDKKEKDKGNIENIYEALVNIRNSVAHNGVKYEEGKYNFYLNTDKEVKEYRKAKNDRGYFYDPNKGWYWVGTFTEKEILDLCGYIVNGEFIKKHNNNENHKAKDKKSNQAYKYKKSSKDPKNKRDNRNYKNRKSDLSNNSKYDYEME